MNPVLDCDELQYFFTFSCRPASRSPSWETCDIPTGAVTLHSVYLCFRCNNNNSDFGIKVQTFKVSLDWINEVGTYFTVSNSESRSFRKALATCSIGNNLLATPFLWWGGIILHRASVSAVWKSWSVTKIGWWHFLSLVLFPGVEKQHCS